MSGLVIPLIYVLAFVAVVLGVQAVAGFAFTARDSVRRVNRRLTMLDSGMKPDEVYAALVRRKGPSALGGGAMTGPYDRLAEHLVQSGLDLSMRQVLLIVGGVAGVLWLLSLGPLSQARGAFALNALVAMAGATLIASIAVWVFIERRRSQRLRKIEEQLPLALDIVNRAIRAGHPVVSAVQLAATEMGDPLGSEFGLIVDETTYGLEFRDALVSFARRTGSQDAHFFAVSVGIQSETGGNLAEILEGLAAVIRGRMALGQKVKALASEGRASAAILSALPIFLIGCLALFQPHFYTDKFRDPVFWPAVGIVITVYLIGQVMIHRIVNFKY